MGKRKTIMLLVTYGCNLRCAYCYEPKTTQKLVTFEQAQGYLHRQIFSLVKKYEDFEVQFMGGEPLMVFPLIKEISEWLWRQPFPLPLKQVFAPTNGTLLTIGMKRWLVDNKERFCLGLSFDGTRLMQNINRSESSSMVDLSFFAQTWPNQSVKMTLSPDTLPYLYEGVLFLYEQGFRYVTTDLAMGNNVIWKQEHLSVLANQLNLLVDFYVNNVQIPRMSMLDMDVTLVLQKSDELKKCGCGEDLVCIDCDGQTYGCHIFSPISSPRHLAKASQEIDFSNHNLFADKSCGNCLLFPLCTSCYGMNYLLTGNVCKQDPFTCKAFKIQFLSACNLQMQLAELKGDVKKKKVIKKIVSEF